MGAAGLPDGRALLEALPVGVALYDEGRRLILANSRLALILGLSPGTLRPLSSFADNIRLIAQHGMFGPGEPESHARIVIDSDTGHERRYRRRHPDGRTFDSHHVPLADGGLLVCLTDTSVLVAMRTEAERTVSRVHAAVACLRVGLAVFSPAGRLELRNRRFPELLGLSPMAADRGTAFDDLLDRIAARGDLPALSTIRFARHVAQIRHQRDTGQVIDVLSEPLPEGGWALTVTDVTPRVQAEDDANRRASLLDAILQQMPHGIAVFAADRRLTMVNEAYHRIMAGAPGQVGDTLEDVIRARLDAGEYLEADPASYVRRLLAVEAGAPFVRRRQRPNGTTIDVRTTLLRDGGHLNIITDVTALAVAEAELARRAELLSSVVEHVPYGIGVYGADRRLRVVNTAYRSIMEGAPIALGETIDEIILRRAEAGEYGAGEYGAGNPADRASAQRRHDSTKPQHRRRQRPDGRIIDVRTAPLPDGSHISVVSDVTAMIAAETELARRADTLDAMLAHIRHGIILWDRHGRIVAANPVVSGMLNAPAGCLVPGRSLADVTQDALDRGNLGDGQPARIRARWLLEQDRSQSHIDQRCTRDGRILEVRSDPTANGGFVTTYTDVTQIREAEEALRLSKSAAEAANAAKSRFLAAMSNELRTPLTTILQEAAAIARDAADQLSNERASHNRTGAGRAMDAVQAACSTEIIGTAARTLLGLIDTILDVARLEAGRFGLAEDKVDLPQLVRAVLRRYDPAAAAAEVALVVDLPENLPLVRADERRLREALGHIVSNAVKFTGPLGSVSIGVRQDWTTGALLIEVADTGAGLESGDVERVFEPFAQVSDAAPGAGLGLHVSRTLMRAHGGDLTLRSIVGHGTAATIHIPADRVLQDGLRDTN